MENIALVSLSRLSTLQNYMATISNNIANADTDGFKSEHVMFDDYITKGQGDENSMTTKVAYVRDVSTYRNLSHGPLFGTGNDLDVAIASDGYFVLESPDGPRYSRNGKFTLNAQGELTTSFGLKVLNEDGNPITFDAANAKIDISRDGTISTDNGQIGRFQIVTFNNPQALQKVSNGLYKAPASEAATPAEQRDLQQGAVEQSNVQPILEMTEMIRVHRAYASVSKIMNEDHERQRKAIDILTRSN